jgi:hypothetical protein
MVDPASLRFEDNLVKGGFFLPSCHKTYPTTWLGGFVHSFSASEVKSASLCAKRKRKRKKLIQQLVCTMNTDPQAIRNDRWRKRAVAAKVVILG